MFSIGQEPLNWFPIRLLILIFIASHNLRSTIAINPILQPEADRIDKEVVQVMKGVIANTTLDSMTKQIAKIVGWLPADQTQIDRDGLYSKFVLSYHSLIPAVDNWPESKIRFQVSRSQILSIRDFQRKWEEIRDDAAECEAIVNGINALPASLPDSKIKQALDVLYGCEKKDVEDLKNGEFEKTAYRSLFDSLDLLLMEMYFSFHNLRFLSHDPPMAINLFGRMLEETSQFHKEVKTRLAVDFPQHIANLSQDPFKQDEANVTNIRLMSLNFRMLQFPYTRLYDDTMISARENEVKRWADLLKDGCFSTGPPSFSFAAQKGWMFYYEDWSRDISKFVVDYKNNVFEDFFQWIVLAYTRDLDVNPSMTPPISPGGILIGDGVWDWDMNKPIQNMRLAWDLMGEVLEEIKCFTRKTYYYDFRNEVLQKTQPDFKNGALFSGISRTMGFPCFIEDELDLATKYCTVANHEICAPMGPLDSRQRPESMHNGGLSLLKPKWIFKYDENEFQCYGRRDFVFKLHQCRCGFVMDCGKDLEANITCPLENNDYLRGQCRGTVGYPCKTLPMAPGMHHQTCKSGYCNMKKNSCEDEPYTYHHSYDSTGTPGWKGVKAFSFKTDFWMLLILYIELINQVIIV